MIRSIIIYLLYSLFYLLNIKRLLQIIIVKKTNAYNVLKVYRAQQIQLISKQPMNKTKPKPPINQHFPIEQLQPFAQQNKRQTQPLVTKKLPPPKAIIKNHSKSLHYSNPINHSERTNILYTINKTPANTQKFPQAPNNMNPQTLNWQILTGTINPNIRPKPHTSSHYNSGRNNNIKHQPIIDSLQSKKISSSFRSNSNYNRLSSVAGISLNQKQAEYRMKSQLNTKCNIRNNKLDDIRRQNKKMAQRLQSLQSQYSTKRLLKAYESQQRLSRRLTQSKMSKRSSASIRDNNKSLHISLRSHSSRGSVKSLDENDSQTSSMRSTGGNSILGRNRVSGNSINDKNKKRIVNNKLHAKVVSNDVNAKNIKFEEHNINKLTGNQFSKFKKLFSNSFSTVKQPSRQTNNYHKPTNITLEKIIAGRNPYVDVEVLSQNSQNSQKSIKAIPRPKNHTAYTSKRKLRQFNLQDPNQFSHQIPKKSSIITNDGLLHRIAQQMYNVPKAYEETDDITPRIENKKKKSTASTNYNNKSLHTQNKSRQFPKSNQKKSSKAAFNYSILPTNLMFGKV